MKKVFSLLIVFVSLQSYGQIKKGQVMFDGSIYGNYYNQNNDDDSNLLKTNRYSFSFRPQFGYFIIDNLSLGITPHFGVTKSKTESRYTPNDDSKSNNFGLGIGIDKYFGAGQVLPFIGATIGLTKSKREHYVYYMDPGDTDWTQEKMNESQLFTHLTFKGGVAYFVNDKVSINLLLDYDFRIIYEKVNSGETGKIKSHDIYLGTGISIFL
jgi:hypothetical protein